MFILSQNCSWNNDLVYNLLNIIDFSEEKTDDIDNQIYYYLKIMGKDINDLSKETGYKLNNFFLTSYSIEK